MRVLKYSVIFALLLSVLFSSYPALVAQMAVSEPPIERLRLYEEEKSLYEKIWLNEDGTRTLEYYGSPVKYYDKDGNILDKEYRIKETADSFVYEEDFKVIFPFSLSDGVKLIFENEEVTVKPRNLENKAEPNLSEDGRILTYEIDDNVSIEYLISDNGLKEYIVVKSYNGTEQYSSEIITNGLIFEDNQLLNGEGELKAYLGEAIVFDKEERNNTIAEADTSLIAEGRYLYTVSLTEEYLERAEYPIRIDPSITLNTTGNIEDVSIVSTTTHSGTSGVLYVGRGSSGAALRALMRFPNLDLSGYTVNSAVVSIRDVMCEHTAIPIECHEYAGEPWSESGTTTWSGCGSGMVGTQYGSNQNITYGNGNHSGDSQRYDFDITGLANRWADGTPQPSKGLIFKATSDYESSGSKTYRSFGSINYNSNGTYYKPWLTVNYSLKFNGVYAIRNVGSLYYAWSSGTNNGDGTYHRDYDNGQYSNWLITYVSDGYYTIKSMYSNKYMGVAGSSTADGASVNIYDTVSDATKWRILPTTSGNYKLIAKCAESYYRALKPQGSYWGYNLKQYTYTDDNDYLDEWEILTVYGSKRYNEILITDTICSEVNCLGYALMINQDLTFITPSSSCLSYLNIINTNPSQYLDSTTNDFSIQTVNNFNSYVKNDFISWLSSNNITNVVEETSFYGNGNYTLLSENQYRIVMRVGLHYVYLGDPYNPSYYDFDMDFHFWYQTCDGTWADKHGELPSEHLEEGIIPSSTATSGWSTSNLVDYYDSDYTVFVITGNVVLSN